MKLHVLGIDLGTQFESLCGGPSIYGLFIARGCKHVGYPLGFRFSKRHLGTYMCVKVIICPEICFPGSVGTEV